MMFFSAALFAQPNDKAEIKKLEPAKIIMEHVSDAHEFHFFTLNQKPVSIPLPVLVYSASKGFSFFMSSAFEEGEQTHEGYRLLSEKFIEENKLDDVKDAKGKPVFQSGKIYAVDNAGMPDINTKVYDFSFTRNVVQLFISLILLVWIMGSVAKKYSRGPWCKICSERPSKCSGTRNYFCKR